MNWLAIMMLSGSMAVLALRADVTLIGGSTRNGNFDADTSSTDIRSFADTPNWYNLGGSQTVRATRTTLTAPSPGGFRNAAVNLNGNRVFGNETGHTLRNGDVFSLSYMWRDLGTEWNDSADQIRVQLFYTDNDQLTGTQTTIATRYSDYSTSNNTWETVTANRFYTASGGAVGKKLFVRFEGWPGDSSDTTGYARVDNFELVLVPEPATMWWVTALGGAAGFTRRAMFRRTEEGA